MEELYIDPIMYTRRPESEGRPLKEMRVYNLLEQLDIPFIRVDHGITATIESCLAVEEQLGIEICKNLFLCNTQKTKFYLLMLPGDKKFNTSLLSKQINSPRLSFAKPEHMAEYLDITPGSVSVLGLMNDKDCMVQLLIDKDILLQEYIGCHPCVNTASLKISLNDLFNRFLPNIKHDAVFVEL